MSSLDFKTLENHVVNNLDIKEVVDKYIQVQKRHGNYYFYYSPFKNERTPSFTVTPNKKIFKCFSTGYGGNVIKFVSLIEHISYEEALYKLVREYFPDLYSQLGRDNDDYSDYVSKMNYLTGFFQDMLFKNDYAKSYIYKQRKLSENVVKVFRLGYFSNYMITRLDVKYLEVLSKLGFVIKKEDGYHTYIDSSIVIPYVDNNGNVVSFTMRLMKSNNKMNKYKMSIRNEYNSEVYFGYYQSRYMMNNQKMIFLTEGQFDCMSLYDLGLPSISIDGVQKGLNKKLINRSNIVYITFDNDKSGKDSTVNLGLDLVSSGYYVKVVSVHPFKDVSEMYSKIIMNQNMVLNKLTKEFVLFLKEKSYKDGTLEKDYIYYKEKINSSSKYSFLEEYKKVFLDVLYSCYFSKGECDYNSIFESYLKSFESNNNTSTHESDYDKFMSIVVNNIEIFKQHEELKRDLISILVLFSESEYDNYVVDVIDYLSDIKRNLSEETVKKYLTNNEQDILINYDIEKIKDFLHKFLYKIYLNREEEYRNVLYFNKYE